MSKVRESLSKLITNPLLVFLVLTYDLYQLGAFILNSWKGTPNNIQMDWFDLIFNVIIVSILYQAFKAIKRLNYRLDKENEALNFKLFAWDVFQEYRFKSTITNGAYYSKPEGYGGLVEQSYQGDMDRYVQEAIEYFHLNFPDLSRNEVIQKIGEAFPFYSSDFALNMHSKNEPDNSTS